MKFLITDSEGTQELLCVNKTKGRIRLKYADGYNKEYIGKVACELNDTGNGVVISVDGEEFIFDYAQTDYIRKVLNAWNRHLNSPWLSEEQRTDTVHRLKEVK